MRRAREMKANRESFVRYGQTRGRNGERYYKAVREGLQSFVKEQAWNCNLPDQESRNYKNHVEASYLCHGIWTVIMKNQANGGKPYSGNEFQWCNDEYRNPMTFHFDIMNNPKVGSCGIAKACGPAKRKAWKKIYHNIGNMAPIPWFRLTGDHSIDGQALHHGVDERWDLFLQVLRTHWEEWKQDGDISFETYMIFTCQQMYFAEIYNSIGQPEQITAEEIKSWNSRINGDSKLISFSPSDGESVDDIAEKIIRLIRIRCRVIGILLQQSQISIG